MKMDDLILSILFSTNHHRQKEAVEKDVPYMKSNGAAGPQKWQQWASQGKDAQPSQWKQTEQMDYKVTQDLKGYSRDFMELF